MKITIFTSNNSRHNYLINLMSEICNELYVVQENNTIFPGVVPGHYKPTDIMNKYFSSVREAQSKIFDDTYIKKFKNMNIMPMKSGDLNNCSLKFLKDFLKSDFYIVFGSSYIKGELVDFLVKKKAINLHMGISPYYRGNDCNFWALYDNNPHLVGSTVHLLTKGLDSGPIIYHALSKLKTSNPFEYTMSTVKAAFHSLKKRLIDKKIFTFTPIIQDKTKEIRYTKKDDFNDEAVKEYYKKKINLNSKNFDLSLLKDPFFLD